MRMLSPAEFAKIRDAVQLNILFWLRDNYHGSRSGGGGCQGRGGRGGGGDSSMCSVAAAKTVTTTNDAKTMTVTMAMNNAGRGAQNGSGFGCNHYRNEDLTMMGVQTSNRKGQVNAIMVNPTTYAMMPGHQAL